MLRFSLLSILVIQATFASAASLNETNLNKTLNKVARISSQGAPRAINPNIVDRGYTVENKTLIDHLSVQPAHAALMKKNSKAMRIQLQNSVCSNNGYRQLLQQGATLRYDFTEEKTNNIVAQEEFNKADCSIN